MSGLTDSLAPIWLPIGPTGARVTIDNTDNEVCLGNRWTVLFLDTILVASGTSIITMTTNSEKVSRVVMSLESDGAGIWQLSEGAIITGGTVITAYNNHRKINTACNSVMIVNPIVSTVGTVLGTHDIGTSTGGASKSGGDAGFNPWIFKQNTTYMLKFTAVASNTIVNQGLYFYEGDV